MKTPLAQRIPDMKKFIVKSIKDRTYYVGECFNMVGWDEDINCAVKFNSIDKAELFVASLKGGAYYIETIYVL